jgi:plastocyanin
MFTLRLAVVSTAVALSIACGGSYSSSPASPSPSPSPSPGGASTAVTIQRGAETLGNRAFAPDDLTVATGTTVTWTNTDSVAHTSTANANGWNSGIVSPGDHFSFTFQTPGTFSYHCSIHPGMVGTVVVQ